MLLPLSFPSAATILGEDGPDSIRDPASHSLDNPDPYILTDPVRKNGTPNGKNEPALSLRS
ncbi:MAG: hypothetical protein ABIP48_33800, partial [Planctomycetota bacterium]